MPASLRYIAEGFPYPLSDSEDAELPQQGPLRVDGWEKWIANHPDHYFTAALLYAAESARCSAVPPIIAPQSETTDIAYLRVTDNLS